MMNYTSYIVAAVLGVSASFGLTEAADVVNPKAQGLYIEEFYYDGNSFNQTIASISELPKGGHWSAEISRDNEDGTRTQLCSGSGNGVYNGEAQRYDPNEWTGDDCPELTPDDTASAAWEYVNENGVTQSVGIHRTLRELGWTNGGN